MYSIVCYAISASEHASDGATRVPEDATLFGLVSSGLLVLSGYSGCMKSERKANHARRICPGYRRMRSVREMQIRARKESERGQLQARFGKTSAK